MAQFVYHQSYETSLEYDHIEFAYEFLFYLRGDRNGQILEAARIIAAEDILEWCTNNIGPPFQTDTWRVYYSGNLMSIEIYDEEKTMLFKLSFC